MKRVEGKCKNCCNIKPTEIPNLKDDVLQYHEFVVKMSLMWTKKIKEIKESRIENAEFIILSWISQFKEYLFQMDYCRYVFVVVLFILLYCLIPMKLGSNIIVRKCYRFIQAQVSFI